MKNLLLLIFSLIAITSNSQELIGKICNSEENEPISFVNIGVLNRNTGTVSNINGEFKLTIDSSFVADSIRISCIGFYSKSYLIKELIDKSSNQNIATLSLTPKDYQIKEVTIRAEKAKIITLGNPIKRNDRCKLRTDSQLGSELGLFISLPKRGGKYLLKDFTFNLSDHDFETDVRINIYKMENSMPSDNILREPIFITIPSNRDIMTIDLSKYNIQIDKDFFISVEHFKKHPDKNHRLKFNCVVNKKSKTRCYSRKVSQGDWTEIKNVGVQFKIRAYAQ